MKSAEAGTRAGGASFRVLFVCTGNICRSPMAEWLLRAALAPCTGMSVESAGTHAAPGTAMSPAARRVLADQGVDAEGFTARLLDVRMIAEADLVLTAERTHRAWVAGMDPRALDRTFTIVEFGALAAAVPSSATAGYGDLPGRARELTRMVRHLRGVVPVDRPDLRDPYKRPVWAYRVTARRVQDALAVPVELMTSPVTHRPAVAAGS